MEAKDTVMSDEALEENIQRDYKNFQVSTEPDRITDILLWTTEVQAEITWDIAEKVGMQKVVDFISQDIGVTTSEGGIFIQGYIAAEKYKSFLKENGLKEG